MKSRLIPILIANLFGACAAFAADGDQFTVTGSVSVGGISTNKSSGTVDAAKLNEYRDLKSGGLLNFDLKGRSSSYYLDAYGENLGRDDQTIDVKGGGYRNFKYELYNDNLVHNWAFGALAPYSGVGGDTLTFVGTPPNANTATWSSFDYRMKRRNTGGMVEWSFGSPWFIRFDANEVRDTGLKLIAGSNGTSPGNGFIDKPFPIDYRSQNLSLEGGYAEKRGQISVNVQHSKFSNGTDYLYWQNPYFQTLMDTSTLAADNSYTKFGLNGALKQLPLQSTLAGRVTYSKTTNDIPILSQILNGSATQPNPVLNATTTGALAQTYPDATSFQGDVVHKTASLSLHSNPTRELDTRLYLNRFEKDNKSTQVNFLTGSAVVGGVTGLTCGRIVQGATVINPGDCSTEAMGYKKNDYGLDVGYRINGQNRVVGGFEYVKLDRDRVDFNETKDRKLTLEYRNTSLDWLAARVKVQNLQRRSNFLEGSAGTGPNDPEYLNRFIARFDASNVDQNLAKLVLDISPAELWDVSFEGILKNNKYKDTVLGRTKDTRQEFYVSVGYGEMQSFRVMAFADLELVQYDSYHRNISTVSTGTGIAPNDLPSGYCTTAAAGVNCYDPSTAPNSSNYNWDAKNKDRNWAIGVGADWLPAERLKLNASFIVQQTTGTVDFAVQPGANPATPAVNISNFDNTRKTSLNLKGVYSLSKQWSVIGGYSHERYKFNDIAYDGYRNTIPVGTSGTCNVACANAQMSYLSGQGAFPNYIANIFYAMGTYKF